MDVGTYGHCDLQTHSAPRAELVKIKWTVTLSYMGAFNILDEPNKSV